LAGKNQKQKQEILQNFLNMGEDYTAQLSEEVTEYISKKNKDTVNWTWAPQFEQQCGGPAGVARMLAAGAAEEEEPEGYAGLKRYRWVEQQEIHEKGEVATKKAKKVTDSEDKVRNFVADLAKRSGSPEPAGEPAPSGGSAPAEKSGQQDNLSDPKDDPKNDPKKAQDPKNDPKKPAEDPIQSMLKKAVGRVKQAKEILNRIAVTMEGASTTTDGLTISTLEPTYAKLVGHKSHLADVEEHLCKKLIEKDCAPELDEAWKDGVKHFIGNEDRLANTWLAVLWFGKWRLCINMCPEARSAIRSARATRIEHLEDHLATFAARSKVAKSSSDPRMAYSNCLLGQFSALGGSWVGIIFAQNGPNV
jgi:hypothetical protein